MGFSLVTMLLVPHAPTRSMHRTAACRLCAEPGPPFNDLSASLQSELEKRGLQSALDALAEDGPSAFKDAHKIIEYVMLSLQHKGSDGIEEAFRFTARKPGSSSFVSGLPLSTQRISWKRSRFIGGYVSGKTLELDEFAAEVQADFSPLLDCAQWRWATTHPITYEPLMRSAERDFCREYVVVVDEKPVAFQMFCEWDAPPTCTCCMCAASLTPQRERVRVSCCDERGRRLGVLVLSHLQGNPSRRRRD